MDMNVFDWREYFNRRDSDEPTRDALIEKAFQQYVEGHDRIEDKSENEREEHFATFKASWLIAEMMFRTQGITKP